MIAAITTAVRERRDRLLAQRSPRVQRMRAISEDCASRIPDDLKNVLRLNLGDCFAYALAKVAGEALLFTGNDFTHTDVTAAAR